MSFAARGTSLQRIAFRLGAGVGLFTGVITLAGTSCPLGAFAPGVGVYNNMSDPTNDGASYVTSSACRACHPQFYETHRLTGHANAMRAVTGLAPSYPSEAPRADVPNPPEGFAWSDISYVTDGYLKGATFLDNNGFLLTTGQTGRLTQWRLDTPSMGQSASFAKYEPGAATPLPFDDSRFSFFVTGPQAFDPAAPMYQDNRPGLAGRWHETGVHCEACHGPGSNHVPNPFARALFVDPTGAQSCRNCHSRPFATNSTDILARDGFIQDQQQWTELKASGGHANFACTICHNPHRSSTYDRAGAIRNDCLACHADRNMALHRGKVFRRGDYVEPLTCQSCHMPFAVFTASRADATVVGPIARMGDTRSHIFRLSKENMDYTGFFSEDGTTVRRDNQGRARITVDFVCLRCHNENALPTLTFTVERAAEIAIGLHADTPLQDR